MAIRAAAALLQDGKPVQGQVRVPVTFELGPVHRGDPIMVDHSGDAS